MSRLPASPLGGFAAFGPLGLLGLLAFGGCEIAEVATPESNNVCDAPSHQAALPVSLEETSGVAASRSHTGIFWTHNDSGGEAAVFAIDSAGVIRAVVRVEGATNRDWEDIAIGPCEPEGPDCLWIADIGDNAERHPHVAVYRIPEPALDDSASPAAATFRLSYPDGPRDAEGLFVTDAGIHLVNKGRSDAIELFRRRPPYEEGTTAVLERVQRLAPPPTSVSAQVTAAAADPEGTRALLRTYSGLRFFAFAGDTLRPIGRPADAVASQLQGEGADFAGGDRYVLTGEAQGNSPATVMIVACDPLRPPADTGR